MILIYTHSITARVSYTVELIFGTVLGIPYELTDDRLNYEGSVLPKLAYTYEKPDTGIFLEAGALLFETHLRKEIPVRSGSYKNFPLVFEVGEASALPYDLFSTVFYVATCYEEYLPFEGDRHGRYMAEQSSLHRWKVLGRPFLHELIADFAAVLKSQNPELVFKTRPFNFLSTIDIDNAFAYAHKGFARNAGGLLKDLLSLRFGKAAERLAANGNDAKDPYNTFDLINGLSAQTQTALQYFVLIGDYAAYDKNPRHTNAGFRKLLRRLAGSHSMGLHPSYQAYDDPGRIGMEKQRLEAITGKPVTSARCHFLRVKFPETYRRFVEAGITDDYTMIYASQCGFRTGLCVPYQWFDLERNEATSLTLHPSTVMEGTLRDYNQLDAGKAQELCYELMAQVKKYGGEFVSIFHNDSFVPEQKEWIAVYKNILQESRKPNTNH